MNINSFSSLSYIFTNSNNKGWGYVEKPIKLALGNTKASIVSVERLRKEMGKEKDIPTVGKQTVESTRVIPRDPHQYPQAVTDRKVGIHMFSTSYPQVREIIGINLEA